MPFFTQYLKNGFQVVCYVLILQPGHSIAGIIKLQLYDYLGRGMARGPAQQDARVPFTEGYIISNEISYLPDSLSTMAPCSHVASIFA